MRLKNWELIISRVYDDYSIPEEYSTCVMRAIVLPISIDINVEESPTPNGGKIGSNFAAPLPGVIESVNHGRSLFQQWQHGSGFCTNFRTSGCT